MDKPPEAPPRNYHRFIQPVLIVAALALILAVGAYFRFIGINWDTDQHQHPDERFMTMVAEGLSSLERPGLYFDPEGSTLNPLDTGFYTYGLSPLFLTRYVAEWLNRTSYNQIVLVGRALSGLFDLAALAALFLLGARLYNRWVGLLAAALYAAAVVPIQLSHYFAVDTFTTVFILAALYVAVLVMEKPRWWLFALFGVFTGLAMSTKVSIAPLAGLAVVAGLAYVADHWSEPGKRTSSIKTVLVGLLLAGLTSVLVFRVFQPYAFSGPGVFGLRLNPRWLEIIREVSAQVAGRADFPPNHHWAGRPWSYGWTNMVQWGMGWPLGLAATASWVWAAWRMLRGDWRRHLLPVLWVGGFFLYQSSQFWRYTRYYLPVYPVAILLAAWALVEIFKRARARQPEEGSNGILLRRLPVILAGGLIAGLLVSTYAYAFAFTRIYTRPHARLAASTWMFENIPGPLNVQIETPEGIRNIPLSMPYDLALKPGDTWSTTFTPNVSGSLVSVSAPCISPVQPEKGGASLALTLAPVDPGVGPALRARADIPFQNEDAQDGVSHKFALPDAGLEAGQEYRLTIEALAGDAVQFSGAAIAVESSWDDDLPFRTDNYDPYGGIYRHLNLELYEPDTEDKRQHLLETLNRAEYIVIASNRVYDAVPRLPLRYPMTLAYYQALFDCASQQITDCAYPAVAPQTGGLGFELVATFESYPTLGPLSIPDQTAQESFTVYDHPKVLVFKKSTDYSPGLTRALLESVDLTQVVGQDAKSFTQAPTGLQLSPAQSSAQKTAGTWADIFSTTSALNRYPFLGVIGWYLFLFLAGWLAFPLTFFAFKGLPDRGYGLARLIGLSAVAWMAWMSGSLRLLPFTRPVLWLSLGLLWLSALGIAWANLDALVGFIQRRWRHLVTVELIFLVLFAFDLVVRLNNPDLWHPWRGGEKPGDFALFNAILKSAYFPPYDPWMAGNFVNYYYYGYVLAAVPTKLLGVVPSTAYNLLVPTWYALTGIGVFSVVYNLVAGRPGETETEPAPKRSIAPYLAGIVAILFAVVLGNLVEFRLLWKYLPEFATSGAVNPLWPGEAGKVFAGLQAVISGEASLFSGDNGRWYFDASRAILNGEPSAPITEFPFFTFLYADLHPHLLDMPIVLAALAWILSILLAPKIVSKAYRLRDLLPAGATWLVAGLVFGAMYPTNTWDFPVILGLGLAAVLYAVWVDRGPDTKTTILRMLSRAALLLFMAYITYAPFRRSFATGDLQVELWHGPRTPLINYLSVHGLFLFLILTFLVFETAQWIRSRYLQIRDIPLGELQTPLIRVLVTLVVGLAIVFIGYPWLWRNDLQTAGFALILGFWAGLLLLRRDQSVHQRIALALIGAGLGLTIIAEFITLKGDVGRMNIVFKLYLLMWLFFSIAVAWALVWIAKRLQGWKWRWVWWAVLICLVLAASAYPLVGTAAKITDRWTGINNPPRTLDGMAFMLGESADNDESINSAVFSERGHPLYLASDYLAIRWMLETIPGTPTIVEGHTPEYRWGSRYAVYTGLPTVVGWSWHLRQHNAILPDAVVENRIQDVENFYNTEDTMEAMEFLERYQVDYIIIGDLEQALYSANGLAKFPQMVLEGELKVVYPKDTSYSGVVIYAVQRDG